MNINIYVHTYLRFSCQVYMYMYICINTEKLTKAVKSISVVQLRCQVTSVRPILSQFYDRVQAKERKKNRREERKNKQILGKCAKQIQYLPNENRSTGKALWRQQRASQQQSKNVLHVLLRKKERILLSRRWIDGKLSNKQVNEQGEKI